MRAFIFDLDGVIVSTDRFHYRAWKQMADRIGISFDESFNNLHFYWKIRLPEDNPLYAAR